MLFVTAAAFVLQHSQVMLRHIVLMGYAIEVPEEAIQEEDVMSPNISVNLGRLGVAVFIFKII
jgi:hypothetical protein